MYVGICARIGLLLRQGLGSLKSGLRFERLKVIVSFNFKKNLP